MKKKIPDVLVLNLSWVPIHLISWQKSMALITRDYAHSLDREFIAYNFENWLAFSEIEEHYPVIHSATPLRICIPEIIVLKRYNRLPYRDVKYSRQTLFQRDNFKCGYCGNKLPREQLTVDHIIPRCMGGTSNWDNTVACCVVCNAKKADQTLKACGMKLLTKPKKPVWVGPLDHIHPDHPCKSWRHFMNRISIDEYS